jgi:hypothetical protein
MSDEKMLRAAKRLRTALRLHDAGVAMKRAQLRRLHPAASDAEISKLLASWLRTRPGAEHGDSSGSLRAAVER